MIICIFTATGMAVAAMVTSVVSTITSTTMSAVAASQQAANARAAADRTRKQQIVDHQALVEKGLQEANVKAEHEDRLRREAAVAKARASVMATQAGVEGNTVNQLLRDIERQKLEGITASDRNLRMAQRQLGRTATSIDQRAENTVAGLDAGPGLGGIIAGGALNTLSATAGGLSREVKGTPLIELITK